MDSSDVDYEELNVAVREHRSDLHLVARSVGMRAARFGAPLSEVFARLEQSHGGAQPTYDVAKSAAEGYHEALTSVHLNRSCEDPLTGWSSLAHLRAVLAGKYRRVTVDEVDLREQYALVVIEISRTETVPLELSLFAIDVARAVHAVFGADETLVQLRPRRFAVLIERKDFDSPTSRLLSSVLKRDLSGPEPRLTLELLPSDESDLERTLAGLAR